jgi:anti-anti-sigma factor
MTGYRTDHEVAVGTIEVVRVADTVTALELEGEFDMSQALDLTEHATKVLSEDQDLIVNLSDVTFIDSTIVRAFFGIDAAAREGGRAFVLQFATSPGVERVLSITAADAQLTTARSRAEAIDLIESART